MWKTKRNAARRGVNTASGRSLWATFMQPGWVITAVLIVAFSYLAFTVLAPWQLGKNAATSERNAQLDAAFEVDPVHYTELFDSTGTIAPDSEWRRVTLHGHYLPRSEVLLRMRPIAGAPAFEALTPFQTDEGSFILVNRGYVPAENTTVPHIDAAPEGAVTIVGHVRKDEQTPAKPPIHDQGYPQVWGINTQMVGALTHLHLATDFVQLTAGQPGVLTAQPLPQKKKGPYLSYGLQWIAFGIMAPLGLVYFIVAELKERRRDQEDEEAWEASQHTDEAQHEVDSNNGTCVTAQPSSSAPPPPDSPENIPPNVPQPEREPAATAGSTNSTSPVRYRARYAKPQHQAFYRRANKDEDRF